MLLSVLDLFYKVRLIQYGHYVAAKPLNFKAVITLNSVVLNHILFKHTANLKSVCKSNPNNATQGNLHAVLKLSTTVDKAGFLCTMLKPVCPFPKTP